MLLFRSEEHLKGWISQGHLAGEQLSIAQQWDLARRWFKGRHLPDWRRRTQAEAQDVFRSVGLESAFWRFD